MPLSGNTRVSSITISNLFSQLELQIAAEILHQASPPSHDAGDLLIAVIGLSNAATNPAETMNTETGWTKMTEGTWSSATAGSTTVFYNFDEDDSITTVEFDSTGTTGYVAKGFAYRGVDTLFSHLMANFSS